MTRPKCHMSRDVFEATLRWIGYFVNCRTQGQVVAAGIGESLLNPHVIPMLAMLSCVLDGRPLILPTNGSMLSVDMAKDLSTIPNLHVFLSAHRLGVAEIAKQNALDAGLSIEVTSDPFNENATDWQGRVAWKASPRWNHSGLICPFRKHQGVVALADGSVSSCCYVTDPGEGVLGNIRDDLTKMEVRRFSLCEKCYQDARDMK